MEGNIVKQTYRVIPRTTLAGLIAAMLGIGRDQYYDLFAPNSSAIAVEPVTDLRTINMPENTLSTADEHIDQIPRYSKSLKVGLPNPTHPRQQHNYEVLVDPAYRIDLWLADEPTYRELYNILNDGRSYYVPSLGLSEHLAEVDFHGEFDVGEGPTGDTIEVDSTVPEAVDSVVVDAGTKYGIERSPAFMEARNGGRVTTGFSAHSFNPAGGSLTVRHVDAAQVDGRTVMFA